MTPYKFKKPYIVFRWTFNKYLLNTSYTHTYTCARTHYYSTFFCWFFFCFFLINLFIYLFLGVLGLRFCARAFSSCSERGPLFIAVRGPLTVAASLVAEHRLQTRRLSNCGSRDQSLHGMWDLPSPGLEPVSPALAGRFSTTAPAGKPYSTFLYDIFINGMYLYLLCM